MAATGASGKTWMCQEEFEVPLACQAAGCWLWLEQCRERLEGLPPGYNCLGSFSAS